MAAQNFMLAAFASGFATCPIGLARAWLNLAEVKAELGIPPEFVVVVSHCGRYAEHPDAPAATPQESSRCEPFYGMWRTAAPRSSSCLSIWSARLASWSVMPTVHVRMGNFPSET